MYWICPLCGYQNEKTTMRCMCGFQADESVLDMSTEPGTDIFEGKERVVEMPLSSLDIDTAVSQQPDKKGKEMDENQHRSDDEIFVKDIESWKISFSKKDQCLYFSTPALQSFRLKLAKDDLKEILDIISEKVGVTLTSEKRYISGKGISEFIEMLEKMIEVKKSKVKIKFSDDELQGLVDIINRKLHE